MTHELGNAAISTRIVTGSHDCIEKISYIYRSVFFFFYLHVEFSSTFLHITMAGLSAPSVGL